MVQTYGVAREYDGQTTHASEAVEGTALLGVNATAKRDEGHATIISCISNLTNTTIGSGKLTPSAAFSGP